MRVTYRLTPPLGVNMNEFLSKLFLVTGSIFEPQKYGIEAIIVWLPCGLTSIRWELFDFLKKINNQNQI